MTTPVITQVDLPLSDRCNLNCSFCFEEGTKVLVPGFQSKPIDSIQVGDVVMGWDYKDANSHLSVGKLRPVTVTAIHSHVAVTGQISVLGRTLRGTPNHSFLGSTSSNDTDNRHRFVHIEDAKRIRVMPAWVTDKSREWWEGWLCGTRDGDGCCHQQRNRKRTKSWSRFYLALYGDKGLISKIFFDKMTEFGYPVYWGNHRHGPTHFEKNGKSYDYPAGDCAAVWLTKSDFADRFEKLWGKNRDFYFGYLAGLIDTDGDVLGGSIRISQIKPWVRTRILEALSETGFKYCEEDNSIRILLGRGVDGRRVRLQLLSQSTPIHPVRNAALLGQRTYEWAVPNWKNDQRTAVVYNITTESGTYVAEGCFVKNCYTKGGYGHSFNQTHIDKCFNWMFGQFNAGATEVQRQHGIRVSIYGGEPLLEWKNLQNVVVNKKAEAQALGIKLQFSLVTNMTLLTEDKLDWLIKNNVGIHPSIDGCAEAQDSERKFHNGTGTSTIVYENARRLVARLPGRSCRMTVAPSTVKYLFESIVFLTKDIGFKTVNAVLAGGVEWTDDLLDIHKEQIGKVTDWWIDEMRQGRHWSLYHLRNMFMGIWTSRRRRGLCSAGMSQVGIDTEGNIYACHRFCNLQSQPDYLLGTIDTGFTNLDFQDKLKNYDLAVANKDRCKDCPAVMGCHAFCLHEMMLAGNGMFEPLPHYCKVWPFYWQMAMRAHSILMAENNQLYVQHYDPRVKQIRDQRMQQQRIVQQQKLQQRLVANANRNVVIPKLTMTNSNQECRSNVCDGQCQKNGESE